MLICTSAHGAKHLCAKECNPELRFLRSARHLILLNICVKFHEIIYQTVQCSKGNNSKRIQSRVVVTALCLMVLNICVKFQENISNGFDVTERTRVCGRNGNIKCSKGNNSKSMQSRVTVPVLYTSTLNA